MGLISVQLDLGPLRELATLGDAVQEATRREAQLLLAQTHAHIVEEASEKLHARRQMYVDALSFFEEDGVYVVNLDASAVWIEDGQEAFSLLPGLLNSPKAKVSKSGSRYMVVPFTHNVGPSVASPAQKQVVESIKSSLKAAGVPYGKVERDQHGNPKLGMLHDLRLSTPAKTGSGPGWGRGPAGEPIQGWSHDGKSGTPILKGAKIFQHQKSGGGTQRSVMTFRVASEEHEGQDRWNHPGTKPLRLFESAAEWARTQWDKEIVPRIVEQLTAAK